MKQIPVSRATLGRLPVYLQYLQNIQKTTEYISATTLARALGLGEVQVRKDLNAVSGAGRPKVGYKTAELISAIESFLSHGNSNGSVVLIGAGKLGRALLDYSGFLEYGLEIDAAFDNAITEPLQSYSGKMIYPIDFLQSYCRKSPPVIGIIAVPAHAAQDVCDQLIHNGVRAIWCFAPCTLSVPDGFPVQYENMALSLAYLRKMI